jgi:predicted dehydrogenase
VPNSHEAELLFNHPVLTANPSPPVLLEAFHSRFTPAWKLFQSLLSPPDISHVIANAYVPAFVAKDTDIRFNYEIGGGALLDLGTYPVAAVRSAFGAAPTECIDANLTAMPPPRERCDHSFQAKFTFPNGGVGEIDGTLRATNWWITLPTVTVTHRPVAVSSKELKVEAGNTVTRTRKVVFVNFLFASMYHRVDVIDEFVVTTSAKEEVKRWTTKETKKAYTFREIGVDQPGEVYWTTYRHMLEQFVDRIKGRKGSGIWVDGEDSVTQARMLDMIYTKGRLGVRPESKFLKEVEGQIKD